MAGAAQRRPRCAVLCRPELSQRPASGSAGCGGSLLWRSAHTLTFNHLQNMGIWAAPQPINDMLVTVHSLVHCTEHGCNNCSRVILSS